MREILFRDKRKDNGDWIYGYYCKYGFTGQQKHYIIPDCASALYSYEVIPESVSEITGLRDKKRKMIFEGDIIKHFNQYDEPDKYVVYQVEFNERTCKFVGYLHKSWSSQLCQDLENRYEVIGNIHDNPELLKGGADE